MLKSNTGPLGLELVAISVHRMIGVPAEGSITASVSTVINIVVAMVTVSVASFSSNGLPLGSSRNGFIIDSDFFTGDNCNITSVLRQVHACVIL